MMNRRTFAAVAALALLIGACSKSDPTQSAEYLALAESHHAVDSELAQLREELATEQSTVTDLNAEIAQLSDELATVEGTLEDAESNLSRLTTERDTAQARVDELLLTYDDEIRAELQANWDAEVARACAAAKDQYTTAISALVRWTETLTPIGSSQDLINLVDECAAADRAMTTEQRETARLAACESVDVDSLERDPDAYSGRCVHVFVRVVQWDSNTGVCSFRAELRATYSNSWYNYDGNAIFNAKNLSSCPELDGMDTDDFLEIWATGQGSLTYDTTIGGSATATLWTIERATLKRKN